MNSLIGNMIRNTARETRVTKGIFSSFTRKQSSNSRPGTVPFSTFLSHRIKTNNCKYSSNSANQHHESSFRNLIFTSLSSIMKVVLESSRENSDLIFNVIAWLVVASLALELRKTRKQVSEMMAIFHAQKESLEREIDDHLRSSSCVSSTAGSSTGSSNGSSTGSSNGSSDTSSVELAKMKSHNQVNTKDKKPAQSNGSLDTTTTIPNQQSKPLSEPSLSDEFL
jgi:hypothetical protein